jgi:uncharacterized membrane protein
VIPAAESVAGSQPWVAMQTREYSSPRRRTRAEELDGEPESQATQVVARLLPRQRQEAVLALVARRRWITVRELRSELQVSEATVRRDLDWLARRNLIIRLHGGAQWQERR